MDRLEEFLVTFGRKTKPSLPSDESCDLTGSFEYCALAFNKRTRSEKRHYFDDPNDIQKIIGNYESLPDSEGVDVKIYDRHGTLKSRWQKLL